MSDDREYFAAIHARYDHLHDLYDRAVFSLAGGALGISVTFIGDIVGKAPVSASTLGRGWALLVASLLCITVSYIPGIEALRRVLTERDKQAIRVGRIAYAFSILGGLFLAGGLALLARFSYLNL